MDSGFDQSIASLVHFRDESASMIKSLQAENAALRETIVRLEQQQRESGNVRSPVSDQHPALDTPITRPSKVQKLSDIIQKRSASQRLVKSSNTPDVDNDSCSKLDQSGASEDDQEEGEEEECTLSNKAAFKLIAHSGEEREEICPKTRNITLPVLVKSYVEFVWRTAPKCALVMLRPGDLSSLDALKELSIFLFSRNIRIIVETLRPKEEVDAFHLAAGAAAIASDMIQVVPHHELQHKDIDFIVTLGGDGTFIHAAEAFPRACPPILAFAFGSLGFLTPFPAKSMFESLEYLMNEEVGLRLRARLEVEVRRAGYPVQVHQVLNECVIDRGTTSSLVRLMLYSNRDGRQPVTIVQGDGLILASPTGSTAYSLSAGGSMVHPSVPAILVTPICPHSLSFRPILVPDSATLRVQVAFDARNSAYLSLDGRPVMEMKQGDEFTIRYSSFPVPAIMSRRTSQGDSDGWLSSLRTALNWNATQSVQKPL